MTISKKKKKDKTTVTETRSVVARNLGRAGPCHHQGRAQGGFQGDGVVQCPETDCGYTTLCMG